jgi:hypothetical protein
MGVTPGHQLPDISPVKDDDPRANGIDRQVMSSSPPPMDAGLGSPSKPARSSQAPFNSSSSAKKEATPGIGRKENGVAKNNEAKFGGSLEPVARSNVSSAAEAGPALLKLSQQGRTNPERVTGDDDEDEGGFDLAKGFAPIGGGSFQSNRSSSIGVGRATS